MIELDRLADRYGDRIDAEIRSRLHGVTSVSDFEAMMAYPFGYADEHKAFVGTAAGKRFRSLLCVVACAGAGGVAEDAMPTAAAIEILHNFSLVHDDIEDRDPIRRHRPTVWKLWGDAHGINVGDGMLALAGRTVLDASADHSTALALARRFQDTALVLTEGQYLDMAFESRTDVTVDDYLNMIGKKTSALIETSVWSGGRLAGADEITLKALEGFGRELGYAFQIRDDIAGIWDEQGRTGKAQGIDIHNRKKTLPVLLAMDAGDKQCRSVVREHIAGGSPSLDELMAALDASECRARSIETMVRHSEAAIGFLLDAHIRQDETTVLRNLVTGLTTY